MNIRIIIASLTVAYTLSSCVGYKLSDQSYTQAFDSLHAEVQKKYPFIDHKQINMDSLYQSTNQVIKKAELEKNSALFYEAMQNYGQAFNDNHVFVKKAAIVSKKETSGHYGFEIIKLDNGNVVVSQIRKRARKLPKQLKPGVQILSWNNMPIDQAIDSVKSVNNERTEATVQNKYLAKCRALTCAKLNDSALVTIKTQGDTIFTFNLKPYVEKKLKAARYYPRQSIWEQFTESPIDFDVFDEDSVGYIRIESFMPNVNDIALATTFQAKLWFLKRLKIKSLIIDLRGNEGGIDHYAIQMAGHFSKTPMHYQFISKYNVESGQFEVDTLHIDSIKPRKPYFDKEVVILIDDRTVSTGEGLPMVLKDLPNVYVMGQYSSAGAFATGFADAFFKLPDDVVFGFLAGRSLDGDFQIQVDSDANGNGGVEPEIRVPLTNANVTSASNGKTDVVLNEAVKFLSRDKD